MSAGAQCFLALQNHPAIVTAAHAASKIICRVAGGPRSPCGLARSALVCFRSGSCGTSSPPACMPHSLDQFCVPNIVLARGSGLSEEDEQLLLAIDSVKVPRVLRRISFANVVQASGASAARHAHRPMHARNSVEAQYR